MKGLKKVALLTMIALSFSLWGEQGADRPDGLYAVMETTRGEMVFELDYQGTPLTVTSFVGLAEDTIERGARQNVPFYDGLKFYRAIENYAVFSGDPLNNGQGGPGGFTLPREVNFNNTAGQAGTLVMTGLPTESNGSAFFITRGNGDSYLDTVYTPFGRLVSGEKTLNKLQAGDELISVSIERRGAAADFFKTDQTAFAERYVTARQAELARLAETLPDVAQEIGKFSEIRKTLTGIYYDVVYEGFGDTPVMGQTVTVHYVGYLPDGTVFDNSQERGQPFSFVIGQDQIITGWLESILDMKTGEVRNVVIPPEMAYGDRAQGNAIPANSWLVFSIQLLSIE